ncbi:MAG: ABC transporter permease [Saprospiraceae bacterium]|nr:ABC transporter permease [Saprospiraceae bacterium]
MRQILKLATRNIWRNRRRTLITAASILFAVLFAVAISSISKGTWDHMIDSVVHYHFGYIQIHKKGYWDDKTIDNVFDPTSVAALVNDQALASQLVPRIESFALSSFEQATKGALIIGIDPEKEAHLTRPDTRITEGDYLEPKDDGVLVAEGLATYLSASVGDTLVLISQGYHGINAAGKFPIRGLVHFGSPDLNKQLIYLGLEQAKWFYGTEGQITTIVVDVEDADELPAVISTLRASLDTSLYEVMDYKEMMPDLMQAREVDTASSDIILLVLYFIIGFGIFGTILMMLKEREYEFGILKAIGMGTVKLNIMLWLEIIFLGIIGCLAGILVSLPIVFYFHQNPIELSGAMAEAYEKFGVQALLPASTDISIFLKQALVVFLMITVLSIYPMFKLAKLKPVEAMRD